MSLLSNLLRSKDSPSGQTILTDIHSHFIPGIDDGCKTIEESLSLLKKMHENGYRTIVCTPHVRADLYNNNREIIAKSFGQLQERVRNEIPALNLYVGAEYLIDDAFPDHVADGLLSFGAGRYVLVELSFYTPHLQFKNFLQDILMKGYNPVMAHPERYAYWSKHDSEIEELRSAGVIMQINLPSLTGFYGPEVKKRAFQLIEHGLADALGSDTHNEFYLDSLTSGIVQKPIQKILSEHSFRQDEMVLP